MSMSELRGWIDEEEGFSGALGELRRLWRRALARRWLTLALALGAAGAWVGVSARDLGRYRSRVVFRVDEGAEGGEHTSIEFLRRFVHDEILTNEGLLDLMRRHQLSVAGVAANPLETVEWMRDEEIGVEIWRDRFLGGAEDPAPRVSLAFAHRDPKVAYELVCDLAELVAERTENRNVVRAQIQAERLDRQVDQAKEALAWPRAEIARRELGLSRAAVDQRKTLFLELENQRSTLQSLEAQLVVVEEQRDSARLREQLERHKLVMRFEVVEPPQPAPLVARPWLQLASGGALAFLLLLPLVAMAVGAWDQRVFDAADLRRLGLEPLGHVPPFPGDQVGSLDERVGRMMYTEER